MSKYFNLKSKSFLIFFLITPFCINNVYAQKERFNCKMFDQILEALNRQQQKWIIARSLKDKVYITADSSGFNPKVVNISNLSNSTIDSLVKISDFQTITNDSLYYLHDTNLIVDKFGFFSSDCDCIKNNNFYLFSTDYKIDKTTRINIIEVKNVLTIMGNLVIVLKSNKSKDSVQFHFKVVEGVASLIKVTSSYSE